MCGINGIILKQQADIDTIKSVLANMNQLIFHRGPDEDGFFTHSDANHSFGMAMRRLSIIDLSSGKQPIYNQDKSIVIVFNGEIYNFKTLKAQLIKDGITEFDTKSDTEVILKLYEQKGVEAFKLLDGMFGFTIYDKNINKLFIARDFFGEKPLYYYSDDKQMLWASELKSIVNNLNIHPEISKEGLNLYFKLNYIPAPFSIYRDIYKLEANHFITYDFNTHDFEIQPIQTLGTKEKQDISLEEATSKVHDLVIDSIKSRSISDVPLGTFLSGGVDSSIISLGLSQITDKPIDTFSIGFDKASFDETDKSQVVAKLINSNHHEFIVAENDLKQHIDEVLLNFDEPFADSSSLPTYIVANKTRTHVKVALTGDGGDEVFGGYNKYYMGNLNQRYTSLVPKFLHKTAHPVISKLLSTKDDNRGKRFKLKKLINAIDYNGNQYWEIISLGYGEQSNQLLKSEYTLNHVFEHYKNHINIPKPKSLTDYREIDRHMSLEGDMLVKVDRTSMLNSLECRAPFLNKTIWDYTNTLPEKYLLNGWNKKFILKEAFKSEFPKDFLDKSKKGFNIPVGDWLREGLKKELLSYIDKDFLKSQNIFNIDYITDLIHNHLNGKEDNSYKAWTFYAFQKWYCKTYKVNG